MPKLGAFLRLAKNAGHNGKAYAPWIEMYASDDYQDVAAAEILQLDRLFEHRAGEGRYAGAAETFAQATQLEVAFWQMALNPAYKARRIVILSRL